MTRVPVDNARADVQIAVQVSDLPNVHRLLTLLVGRAYELAGFLAERRRGDSWSVRIDCRACDAELLVARLHRVPSVLEVTLTLPAEPPDGPAAPAARR